MLNRVERRASSGPRAAADPPLAALASCGPSVPPPGDDPAAPLPAAVPGALDLPTIPLLMSPSLVLVSFDPPAAGAVRVTSSFESCSTRDESWLTMALSSRTSSSSSASRGRPAPTRGSATSAELGAAGLGRGGDCAAAERLHDALKAQQSTSADHRLGSVLCEHLRTIHSSPKSVYSDVSWRTSSRGKTSKLRWNERVSHNLIAQPRHGP